MSCSKFMKNFCILTLEKNAFCHEFTFSIKCLTVTLLYSIKISHEYEMHFICSLWFIGKQRLHGSFSIKWMKKVQQNLLTLLNKVRRKFWSNIICQSIFVRIILCLMFELSFLLNEFMGNILI